MVDSDSAQFSVSDEVLHLIVTFFADYILLLCDYHLPKEVGIVLL